MSMMSEFKEFAMQGNVMDLAVAVVIGGAFGKIVTSLVENLLTPILSVVTPGKGFSEFAAGPFKIGLFVQSIIDFIVIAFVIFLIVRTLNRFKKEAPAAAPTEKECPFCCTNIPIKATRCGHCTSELKTA